jgi:AcrR family transcriptional regulator
MPKVLPSYKEEARARIAGVAAELFVEKGFRAATMDDLAERLHVSKGALYLYFPSKVDLLRELQAASQKAAREMLERALSGDDPAEELISRLDEVFSEMMDRRRTALWFEMMAEAAHDPALRETIRFDNEQDRRILGDFVRALKRRGLVPADEDPEVLTFLLLSVLHSVAWDLSVGSPVKQTQHFLRAAVRRLLPPPPRRRGAPRARAR